MLLLREAQGFVLAHGAYVMTFSCIALAVLCWRRVAQCKALAAKTAAEMARRDILTGLMNRNGLDEYLTARAAQSGPGDRFAVIALELDGLAAISALAGHAAGEDALIQAANLICTAGHEDGASARLDGGTFVLVLSAADDEILIRRLQDLRVRLDCSILVGDRPFNPDVATGVSLCPHDGCDSDELLRRAHTAVQYAKNAGPERLAFFEPGMENGLFERETLEHELALAVSADEIEPHFQPIVRLKDGSVVAYEILARWLHKGALVPPDRFIPIAERNGLIATLTFNLLRQACARARYWPGRPRLSLNISPTLLCDPALPMFVSRTLKSCDFPYERLDVEITETALIADLDQARSNLARLRTKGVRIALDDFGVGYSSLLRLRELPVDVIKIDHSFVRAMAARDEARAIVASIIQLASSLGLTVTAEGVEVEDLVSDLEDLGCEFGQGYWFGSPEKKPVSTPHLSTARANRFHVNDNSSGAFALQHPRAINH